MEGWDYAMAKVSQFRVRGADRHAPRGISHRRTASARLQDACADMLGAIHDYLDARRERIAAEGRRR